jgi:hypothetical protein
VKIGFRYVTELNENRELYTQTLGDERSLEEVYL